MYGRNRYIWLSNAAWMAAFILHRGSVQWASSALGLSAGHQRTALPTTIIGMPVSGTTHCIVSARDMFAHFCSTNG